MGYAAPALAAWEWLVAGLSMFGGLAYSFLSLSAVRGLVTLKKLGEVEAGPPERFPLLSVLVPACNEGSTLRQALETLLSQDYPNLELVVVDDRSTDDTPRIVDELAERDPRVVALHVRELPAGWLGKVHALFVGARKARGELLLFTDADVHYHAPDVLRRAVALCEQERLDHVCLLPELRAGSFLQESAVDAFGISFFATLRVHELADPESDRFIGVGAFNLVRRSTLEKSEGLEWLRMEVGDDLGLGYLIRRAKGRAGLWLASRELSVLWYPSLREMARGLEKNLFAIVGRYSAPLTFVRFGSAVVIVTGMLLGFASPHWPVQLASFAALASVFAAALAMRRRIDQRLGPGLLVPVGLLLVAGMGFRSAWRCLRSGGITWRGTHYPLGELKSFQRVKV